MTRYDKELQTGTPEYEEAMKPKRDARETAEDDEGEARTGDADAVTGDDDPALPPQPGSR